VSVEIRVAPRTLALDVSEHRIEEEAIGGLRKSLMELEAKLGFELRSTAGECGAGAKEGNSRCGYAFARAFGRAEGVYDALLRHG